jgi:hypothetical protein
MLRYTTLSLLVCKWCGDHSGGYFNFIVNLDARASWTVDHVLASSNTQTL